MGDLDLIEANEAFAVQSLSVGRELGFNPDIVNVNGGDERYFHAIFTLFSRYFHAILTLV